LTALKTACDWGHIAVVQLLIEAGADLNLQSLVRSKLWYLLHLPRSLRKLMQNMCVKKDGTTALMGASKYDHPAVVQALINAGADPSIRNNVSHGSDVPITS
jgi:ankyrin repeat protein